MVLQRQRVGLILGLMAWCMQLVVFVQPFLPGHSVPGFGVCQTIVDAFNPSRTFQTATSQQGNQPLHATSSTHPIAHYHKNQQYQSSQVNLVAASHHMMAAMVTDPVLPTHTVDHHFSHLSCGFCTLYGHAIPPPQIQPLWSPAALTVYITLPRFGYSAAPVLPADYIQPQSRAPPPDYIA